MKNKFIITVCTFLCLFMNHNSSAQDYNFYDKDDPNYVWNLQGDLKGLCVGSGCNQLNTVYVQNNYTNSRNIAYLASLLQTSDIIYITRGSESDGGGTASGMDDLPPDVFQWYRDKDLDGFDSGVAITKEYISPGANDPVDYWHLGKSMGSNDCDDNVYNLQNICPYNLILKDLDNPERTTSHGAPLVMVNKGSDRSATIEIDLQQENGPGIGNQGAIWSGTGISGSGYKVTYSGNQSSTITMQSNPGFTSTASIEIVPEAKVSLSADIQLFENEINNVTNAFKSFVEEKGNTVEAGTQSCSLTGTVERKNVDMYADGSKYGTATSFDLKGTLAQKMPKVVIPLYESGIVNITLNINMGVGTGSVNVKGTIDDSTAAAVEIEGGFEVGFTAFSGEVSATAGLANSLCAEATGSLNVGYFTGGATIRGDSNLKGLILDPTVKVGEISFDYSVSVKVDVGTFNEKCEFLSGHKVIWNEQTIPCASIVLYQKQ